MHKRSEDAMKYQAKAQGQEAEQMMAQVLADDEKAAHEVAMFSKINPPDKKYARKKLIQWASYLQKQYRKTSTKESSGEVPMTMQAFKCHCENVLGLTEQEWKGWWAELLADKTVQRDSEGFRGRLQLWVSMGKRRDVASETGIVHELQEGSNQIKNCSDHDRQVLVDHLKRQTLSVNEELAQLQAPLPLSAGGRGGESYTKSEEKRACSDVEGEPQKKKLRKHMLKPERDAPKFHKAMRDSLEKLQKNVSKASTTYKKVTALLATIPEATKNDDRAFVSYIKSLQHRAQVFVFLEDSVDAVKLFGVFHSGGNGEKPSPTFAPPGGLGPGTPTSSTVSPSPSMLASPSGTEAASPAKLATAPELTDEFIRNSTLVSFVQAFPTRKPFAEQASDAMTLGQMKAHAENVCDIDDADELEEYMAKWDSALKAAGSICSALMQSAQDVTNHWSGVLSKVKRKEKQEASLVQAAQLDKVREEAKRQAEAIKAKHQPVRQPMPSLFVVDVGDLCSGVCEVKEPPANMTVFEMPFFVPAGSCEQIALWLGDATVQKGLTSYAVSYKKSKDLATTGRAQQPLDLKHGKPAADALMEAWKPRSALDISAIDGGASFMSGIWMFGYLPEMKFVGFTPNNCAQAKLMALGEVKTLLLETSSLLQALNDLRGVALAPADDKGEDSGKDKDKDDDTPQPPPPPDQFSDLGFFASSMQHWDDKRLRALVSKGLVMRKHIHKKGELLYVPQGWIAVESSSPGQSLLYGIRKSWMLGGSPHVDRYNKVLGIFRQSQKPVQRMEQILELMKQ